MNPEREVKIANAQGLDECMKLLRMAKAGKYNGYLLEGMACPGGCVAGAGTINVPEKSAAENLKSKKSSPFELHALPALWSARRYRGRSR